MNQSVGGLTLGVEMAEISDNNYRCSVLVFCKRDGIMTPCAQPYYRTSPELVPVVSFDREDLEKILQYRTVYSSRQRCISHGGVYSNVIEGIDADYRGYLTRSEVISSSRR
jgi:hypothetical protein